MANEDLISICRGIPYDPLPEFNGRDEGVIHAPYRHHGLNSEDRKQAINNALRYFPYDKHDVLKPEFEDELENYGHIYMYRFMPKIDIKAYPITEYPGHLLDAKAIMLMITNNLDPEVAQFPQELVTYGSNGQVFSNWAQFLLTMKYLAGMRDHQTLILCSGHPQGLYPTRPTPFFEYDNHSSSDGTDVGEGRGIAVSSSSTTRLVITNGIMVPAYSTKANYDRLFAMGVTMYGQMTAGSFCYIGPQGIVHGTVITLLNVARKYLGCGDMSGKVFLSSGLGGMSGAQAKASCIVGCIGIIAEVSRAAIQKRHEQGWVKEIMEDASACVKRVKEAKIKEESTSIAYHGNIVDLWMAFHDDYTQTGQKLIDFGSDQTSLHNPYNGGYYPYGFTVQQSNAMLKEDPEKFEAAVGASLRKQVDLINGLADRAGLIFWDYGNAFLLEASKACANVAKAPAIDSGLDVGTANYRKTACAQFRYPSYVQDIMGDVFALGFGPFRWICASGSDSDLALTDEIALGVLDALLQKLKKVGGSEDCQPGSQGARSKVIQLYTDNVTWMRHVIANTGGPGGDSTTAGGSGCYLAVGSRARILSDAVGRTELARALNRAVGAGELSGPVICSRDHHDVSGADSPFRETSDIGDGSSQCADMSVQNVLGNVQRGATWAAIHNGGGVGWGQVINNGLGLVLDGSRGAELRARAILGAWDVQNGLSRRLWAKATLCHTSAHPCTKTKANGCTSNGENVAGGDNGGELVKDYSGYVIREMMSCDPLLKVTMPFERN